MYRLIIRRKLAEYLDLPTDYFTENHDYKYNEFSKPNGDGERHFTEPLEDLKIIKKKIVNYSNE